MAKRAKKKKIGLLRWRGAYADYDRFIRRTTAVVLAITSVSMTLVQLGFAGIGLPGEYSAYAVLLLLPVVLGSFLLGAPAGFALGLFAGGVLYLHALYMPLDFYEYTFVNPFTSIILIALVGLFSGVLFAIALRGNPPTWRRYVYIAIVCIVVSWMYSQLFFMGVLVEVLAAAVSVGSVNNDSAEAASALISRASAVVLRMGDVSLQGWVDAALMIVVCYAGDGAVRLVQRIRKTRSISTMFNSWLAVVVVLTFMVTSSLGFCSITQTEWTDAKESADSEVDYLCKQLAIASERQGSIDGLIERHDKDDDNDEAVIQDLKKLNSSLGIEGLLDGYSVKSDGTVLVFDSKTQNVLVSNDDRVPSGANIEDYLSDEVRDAINQSVEEASFERVVFGTSEAAFMSTQNKVRDETVQALEENREANLDETFVLSSESDASVDSELCYLRAATEAANTVVMIMPSDMVYANRGLNMARTTISVFVLLAFVFFLTTWLLKRSVVRRIEKTNDALARITAGDLDARVEPGDTKEFVSLSDGINETVVALKGWIAEAETRMDAELATAKAIQESALPRIFPPFPDILRFDVYASMEPAREVGGDFYDFFLIGDDAGPTSGKLGFVVADVSGKGVPAALFMMNAKALIRGYMESGVELGEAAENINRELCSGNDAGMFVTVFAGILDYATGHVDFVNAGHNPPLLWQNGAWTWLKQKSGLPFGLFDGLSYKAYSVECGIGDQFLLYTDGVTEAMNNEGELFGEERLLQVAQERYDLHPRELVNKVRRSVTRYAAGAEQSDDITILALEAGVPPEVTATLTVLADVDELPNVNEFIHTELDRRLCPLRIQKQLDIAVEELFVNVAHYAYPNATEEEPGMAWISYTYSADPPSIVVDIVDKGIPYNPLAKPDAVTPTNIMDVPIGGLGILMAKRSVDEMSYERVDDSNVVTIVKRW